MTPRGVHYSYEQYLMALEDSELKLEYCHGEIYAMAGGTPQHAGLAANAIGMLRQALTGKCMVYTSDLKVRIETTDLSTYPDATVVCGGLQTAKIDPNATINPTILVEVTSDSTEDYDRGEKLRNYKQLPSLRAVLFVSHRRRQVTVVKRTDGAWDEKDFGAGATVMLDDPKLQLSVDELYAGIEL
jgi:Uma2 family endonuclease